MRRWILVMGLSAAVALLAHCGGATTRSAPPQHRPRSIELSCARGSEAAETHGRGRSFALAPIDPRLECASSGSWALRLDGRWLHVALKGPRTPSELRLGRDERGVPMISFELPPREPSRAEMDKLMLDLFGIYGRDGLLAFGEERTIELELRLPRTFQTPLERTHLIVWQLWQGSPYGPPLRLELSPAREIVLYLLHDQTGSQPCASAPWCELDPPLEGVVELYRSAPLELERWTRVRLRVLPRHAGMTEPGALTLWIDAGSSDRPVRHYRGPIGYDPDGYGSYPGLARAQGPHPNRRLELSLGIYRTAQPRRHQVDFRNVRVTGE